VNILLVTLGLFARSADVLQTHYTQYLSEFCKTRNKWPSEFSPDTFCRRLKTHYCQQAFHSTYTFSLTSVLLRCWLGGRKGIRPVKTEWWGAGMVICLERVADLHMAQLMPLPLSCFSKIQIGFTFLVPAHMGNSTPKAVKRVCVCVQEKIKR